MNEDDIILTHILQCRPIDLVIAKPVLTAQQQDQFEDYRRRRAKGEPLQYILGSCNFMGLELSVNPSVLVPRPETEQLVDHAVKWLKSSYPANTGRELIQVLDLGSGSGNIAIAVAHLVPTAQITSIDIKPQALKLARANAKRHGLENRIEFVQDDFMASFKAFPENPWISEAKQGLFDLIISNPPYIPTGQLRFLPADVQKEPPEALDGGEDGLDFYRVIIKFSPYLLREDACLMMEFGDGQAKAVKALMEARGTFTNITIFQDLTGRDRIIYGKIHH